MPLYAQYDTSVGPPYPVIGWFDTDTFNYASLPALLAAVTSGEWANRITSSNWAIESDGVTLVAYTPPPPVMTLAQQAIIAITAGLLITLGGSSSFSETLFPTDATTQAKLTSVVTTVTVTGTFPNAVQTYPMIDSNGAWHLFNINQYLAVSGAIANYVSALYLIADGNPFGATQLPPPSVSLVV